MPKKSKRPAKAPQKQKKKKTGRKKSMKTMKTPGQMMNPNKAALPGRPAMLLAKPHKDMVKSMCNPWSSMAVGCKWPDGLSARSLAVQGRQIAVFSASASSQIALNFATDPQANYLQASSYAGTVATFGIYGNALTNSFSTTIATAVPPPSVRVVCAGIIIRAVQNAMTAQGTMIVTKLPGAVAPASTWDVTTINGEAQVIPITAGMEVPVIFSPVGSTAYQFHQLVNGAGAPVTSFDSVMITCFGTTASVPVLSIELIVNYEFEMQSTQSTYYQMATPPAKDNPVVRKAVSATHTSSAGIFEKGLDYAVAKLETYAEEALADIWTMFV